MTASTIDRATFVALQDTAGREFVGELVGIFLEEAPSMLREIRSAAANGEAERFRRMAHSLKSNGLTFGALKLAGVAKGLEIGGLPATHGAQAQALHALETEYARAAAELQALRDA